MNITATAISSLLLSLGLATCGWRFFETLKSRSDDTSEKSIGRLLMSLFFLSAAYNGIIGISSLLLIHSATTLLWLTVISHILLTLLAILSVYTVYYIFSPENIPFPLLSLLSIMGGIGLFHINTPLQLAPLLINNLSPGMLVITACLLVVSLAAMLFLFVQLFRRAEARSIKILSATVCALALASTVNIFIQISAHYWQFGGVSLIIIETVLGLIGAGFLLSMISTPALRGATAILLALMGSWIAIHLEPAKSETSGFEQQIWSFAVQAIAIWGVWCGFKFAKQHSFFQQPIGRAITFLTLGLLSQVLAHNAYFAYSFASVDGTVPYPGLPDLGYLLGIALYIIGGVLLARALGINYNLSTLHGKIFATCIFSALLFINLWATLSPTYFSSEPGAWKMAVDLSYTLLETLYLALATIIYLGYRKNKTGTEKSGIITLLFAFAAQFMADTVFTYAFERGWWTDGSYGDLTYLAAYFLMAVALIKLGAKSRTSEAATEKESVQIPETTTARPAAMYGMLGATALFIMFLGWWVYLYFKFEGNFIRIGVSPWTDMYALITVWGIWFGFRQAQRVGGLKTLLGRAISFFTIGLFLQSAAGVVYGFYVNWLNIPVPYPSLADIGWFGSIIAYTVGATFLAKTSRSNLMARSQTGKFQLILPGGLALGLYWLTLNQAGYILDWQEPLKAWLDIAYSFIGAAYVSMGVLAYRSVDYRADTISRRRVGLILSALLIQFCSDTNFVYQVAKGTWVDGSYGDLLLLSAYFAMTMAIILLGDPLVKIQETTIKSPALSNLLLRTNQPSISDRRTITSTYLEAVIFFSNISTDRKNRSLETQPHSTTTPHTFP